jgi:uncharacterized membrane protein
MRRLNRSFTAKAQRAQRKIFILCDLCDLCASAARVFILLFLQYIKHRFALASRSSITAYVAQFAGQA